MQGSPCLCYSDQFHSVLHLVSWYWPGELYGSCIITFLSPFSDILRCRKQLFSFRGWGTGTFVQRRLRELSLARTTFRRLVHSNKGTVFAKTQPGSLGVFPKQICVHRLGLFPQISKSTPDLGSQDSCSSFQPAVLFPEISPT